MEPDAPNPRWGTNLDASEAAREVAESAIQVLGGHGHMTEYTPQRFYRGNKASASGLDPEAVHRDAKLMEIGEGTSQIQRLVLGRELSIQNYAILR